VNESGSLDAAAVVSANRTARNAVSNYCYYGLQALVLLLLQAYVIRSLGQEHYSIWPVLRSCINIAGLIQIGLGAGAARFIAVAIGQRDEQKIQRLVSTYLCTSLVGAIGFVAISVAVAGNLCLIFNVPNGLAEEAGWALVVMGLSGALQMTGSVFSGVLTATQSFIKLNLLRCSMLLVRAAVVAGSFFVFGPNLVWVAVSHLVVSAVEAVGCALLAKNFLSWLRLTPRMGSWSTFREVNTFSLLTLLTAVAARLYWDTDNVIINNGLDPVMVTGYSIVTLILLRCSMLTSLASNAVSAPLAVLYGQGQLKRIANAIYRANRLAVPAGAFFIIFVMLFGEGIIVCYVGPEYSSFAPLFQLIGCGFLISATQNLPSRVPGAFGRIGWPAVMTLMFAILNVGLSLLFIWCFDWGVAGVAAGTVVVQLLYRATFYPVFVASLLEEPLGRFFWKTVVLPLAACLPVACYLSLLKLFDFGDGIVELLLCGVSGSVVHLVFLACVGVDAVDREKARKLMSKVVRRVGHVSV
jgi:O-antigen/teichoic acid export membrane protein